MAWLRQGSASLLGGFQVRLQAGFFPMAWPLSGPKVSLSLSCYTSPTSPMNPVLTTVVAVYGPYFTQLPAEIGLISAPLEAMASRKFMSFPMNETNVIRI